MRRSLFEPAMPNDNYLELRHKVDDFFERVVASEGASMRCGVGCTSCCVPGLSLGPIEAEIVREAVASLPMEARRTLSRRAQDEAPESCVMLDERGRCAIYADRPLVCRSQGLPLTYPDGYVPVEAIRGRTKTDRPVTVCPLNFESGLPSDDHVLDAGRVDSMLALMQRLDPTVEESEARVSLRALAASGEAPA